jgi:hypothetical protein
MMRFLLCVRPFELGQFVSVWGEISNWAYLMSVVRDICAYGETTDRPLLRKRLDKVLCAGAIVVLILPLGACSQDGFQRVSYERLQGFFVGQCEDDPWADCSEPEDYDDNKRRRDEY